VAEQVRVGSCPNDNRVMATGTAIWGDQLTANESAQLIRGGGTIPLPRPDVLLVGGGIVGVATAAALHRAGAGSVLLIEAGRLGAAGCCCRRPTPGATRSPS
jgi:NADPH-dependent 2,4-dienoyl-CoA reductase/sulfur reductase-like enzyme